MYKVELLPFAITDLEDIVRYISETLEAPKAAAKLKEEIYTKASQLKKNPMRYRVYAPSLNLKREYRKMPVKNYSVFFVIKNDTIEIHRVLYSRRNMSAILNTL
jgi:plasmid stabilization system protein ParE